MSLESYLAEKRAIKKLVRAEEKRRKYRERHKGGFGNIEGRRGGLKEFLAREAPELLPKYKTLARPQTRPPVSRRRLVARHRVQSRRRRLGGIETSQSPP